MAKYPRIGRLTIGGVEYPAVINVRLLTQLEDMGISIDTVLTSDSRRWGNLVTLMAMAINTGIRLSGGTMQAVTEDEIADAIDISELAELTEQLAHLLGYKGRTVEAEAPKN